MKQSLLDYGVQLGSVPLLCDNESVVKIAKNPVLHSCTISPFLVIDDNTKNVTSSWRKK
jgi:hypothetical protein